MYVVSNACYINCIVADGTCSCESIGTDTSVSNTNNSPVVKIECEDVEYDHGESSEHFANASSTTWIKVQDISLTIKDKWILEHREKLTDKHINSAQRLLKLKFPNINGL